MVSNNHYLATMAQIKKVGALGEIGITSDLQSGVKGSIPLLSIYLIVNPAI